MKKTIGIATTIFIVSLITFGITTGKVWIWLRLRDME